ncbi:MAG TPA: hypothetical protein EYQ53_03460 [Candidatus Poseidoniales archaeon]|jgi:hypothetical protein|nr:MAG: hypothetical protein CXT69_00790 [Euryarchaeota archaeon]HIG03425.1 hypothetical protein [Candidatus Poseidoniales archaeon]HIK78585.1 hypothetical protein [Candidatus Poseidoniales archaeon]
MGFKAKANAHRKATSGDEKKKGKKNEGTLPCAVNDCDNWADKKMKGRSLSLNDAEDMWGDGEFTIRKGRVRVCKKCYRAWKKDAEDNMEY